MQYFWEQARLLEPIFKKANAVHLFLDFDGTLSPFVSTPGRAKLPKRTRILLEQLAVIPPVTLVIISGRKLDDVKRKINIPNILYSGSHGMEWELHGRRFAITIPIKTTLILREIKKEMIKISQNFKGSIVEDKTFSVAFHYRRVPADKKASVEKLLHKEMSKYLKTNLVSLLFSDQTYDIRANIDWTKGDIVTYYKKLLGGNSTTLYIGDSKTDEDAFKKLRDNITIKVGKSQNSIANYFLKDEKDVQKILNWLIVVLTKK